MRIKIFLFQIILLALLISQTISTQERVQIDLSNNVEKVTREIVKQYGDEYTQSCLRIINHFLVKAYNKAFVQPMDTLSKYQEAVSVFQLLKGKMNIDPLVDQVCDSLLNSTGKPYTKFYRSINSHDYQFPNIQLSSRGRVAVIRIDSFYRGSSSELISNFKHKVDSTMNKHDALVINIVANEGGWLDAAVGVGALFVPKGDTVIHVDYYDDSVNIDKSPISKTKRPYYFPVAIVANYRTASASEIATEIIKYYRSPLLYFSSAHTFGKRYVTTVHDLDGGRQYWIQIGEWENLNHERLEIGVGIPADSVFATTHLAITAAVAALEKQLGPNMAVQNLDKIKK